MLLLLRRRRQQRHLISRFDTAWRIKTAPQPYTWNRDMSGSGGRRRCYYDVLDVPRDVDADTLKKQ